MLITDMFITKGEVLRAVFELPNILMGIPDKLKTQDLYNDAFKISEDCFDYIPEEMRTQKMYAAMVGKKALKETEVPEKSKREDFYRFLLDKNPMQLSDVPPPFITNEMCKLSVEADASNFRHVPYEKRIKELCRVAIEKHPKNLPFIPKHHLSTELTKNALMSDISLFKFTQEDSWTDKICANAVVNEFLEISIVPDKYKTESFYTCLLSLDFYSFKNDIPNQYRGTEYYIKCIKEDSLTFSDIRSLPNENHIDKAKIYEIAFEYSPYFFEHIPKQYRTEEMCKLIFEHDVTTFHNIPDNFRTEDMYIEALHSGIRNIHIPDKYNNQPFYDRLVAFWPSNIQYVPPEFRTYDICKAAVKSESRLFKFVPPDLKTYEIYALKIDYEFYKQDIYNIPTDIKNIDFYNVLINLDIKFFKCVPDEFKNYSMCKNAIDEDLDNFRYVNEDFCCLDLLLYILNYIRSNLAAVDGDDTVAYFERNSLPELLKKFSPKTDADWKEVVKCYPEIIKHITFYDEEIDKILGYTAEEYDVNEGLYLQLAQIAVIECPSNLKYIKEYKLTAEICELAIKANHRNFEIIQGDGLKSSALCLLYFNLGGTDLTLIPKNKQTPEICELAVKANHKNFKIIQNETLKCGALCLLYFKLGGIDLSLIPKNKQTPEICELAVKANHKNFKIIQNETLKCGALCLLYFKLGGIDLSLIPKNKQTPEICELAVKVNHKNFAFIQGDSLKSDALCLLYFNLGGADLSLIPKHKQTAAICELAVKVNHKNFEIIQVDTLKSEALCLRYFELGGTDLSHIPFNKRTAKLCVVACENNCENIYLVPAETLKLSYMSEQRTANTLYKELTGNVIDFLKKGKLLDSDVIEVMLIDTIDQKYGSLCSLFSDKFIGSEYERISEQEGKIDTYELDTFQNIEISDNCFNFQTSFEMFFKYEGKVERDMGSRNLPSERVYESIVIEEKKTFDVTIHIREASIRFTLADSYKSESAVKFE
jgi:uncharacterized protein YkvS